MFKISVTTCPDPEYIAEYTFYFPQIKISKFHHIAHLPIPDQAMGKQVLVLKTQPDGILIWENTGGYYLSNGKKIAGKKLHRVGDRFGFGDTAFEITSFIPDIKTYDHESRYHELTEKHPFMADLFWALKQEMLQIEKDGDS